MPSIPPERTALHGLALPAGREVVVDFERSPGQATVVVTTPGTDAIFWTADGTPAQVNGPTARIIPANVIAADSTAVRGKASPVVGQPASAQVRLISASAATVSVQKG